MKNLFCIMRHLLLILLIGLLINADDKLQKETRPDENIWVYGQFSECSVTCGLGEVISIPVCRNLKTGIRQRDVKCKDTTRPQPIANQCKQANCAAQWIEGEWGECSSVCGGGSMFRSVFCGHATKEGIYKKTTDSSCRRKKPTDSQPCNQFECPRWREGIWSYCSVTCGVGVTTRNVECIQVQSVECLPETKPPTKQTCFEKPCPDLYQPLSNNEFQEVKEKQQTNAPRLTTAADKLKHKLHATESHSKQIIYLHPAQDYLLTPSQSQKTMSTPKWNWGWTSKRTTFAVQPSTPTQPTEQIISSTHSSVLTPESEGSGIDEVEDNGSGVDETRVQIYPTDESVNVKKDDVDDNDDDIKSKDIDGSVNSFDNEKRDDDDEILKNNDEDNKLTDDITTTENANFTEDDKVNLTDDNEGSGFIDNEETTLYKVVDVKEIITTQRNDYIPTTTKLPVSFIPLRSTSILSKPTQKPIAISTSTTTYSLGSMHDTLAVVTSPPTPVLNLTTTIFKKNLCQEKEKKWLQLSKQWKMNQDDITSYSYTQLGLENKDLAVASISTNLHLLPKSSISLFCLCENCTNSIWLKRGKVVAKNVLNLNSVSVKDLGEYVCKRDALLSKVFVHLLAEKDVPVIKSYRKSLIQEISTSEFISPSSIVKNPSLSLVSVEGSRGYGCEKDKCSAQDVPTCEFITNLFLIQLDQSHCNSGDFGVLRCDQNTCYSWTTTEWDECSRKTCVEKFTGLIQRKVSCFSVNGIRSNEENCLSQYQPVSSKKCHNPACQVEWRTDDWSKCSHSCGVKGMRSRRVWCNWEGWDEGGETDILFCSKADMPMPITPCILPSCYSSTCKDESIFCSNVVRARMCNDPNFSKRCCYSCSTGYARAMQKEPAFRIVNA